MNVYDFYTYLNEKGVKIRLDAGEPDLPPPPAVLEAARSSIHELGYTDPRGIPELRERIAEYHGVDPGEVAVAPGSKHAIAAVMSAFREGVGLIAPYWAGYEVIARVFNVRIEVVHARLEDGWRPSLTELPRGVKAVVINYPNNPTGATLSRDEAGELLDLAADNGVVVISDEAYRDIVYGGDRLVAVDYRIDNTVSIYSFSKTFSVPGLRIAYAVGDRKLVRRIIEFNQATITSVPVYAQKAALKALEIIEERSKHVSAVYGERARVVGERLRGSCLRFVEPRGALYYFIESPVDDGTALAYRLADRGIGVFPGEAFGGPRYKRFIRLSLTAPIKELVWAVSVLREVACGE